MADSQTVEVSVLSDFLGLTTRRIQQLSNEGVVFKNKRGEYKFLESVKGYVKYLQAAMDGKDSERGPKYDEEVRKLKRENDIAESFVERLEDIEAVFTPIHNSISKAIDQIPNIASEACPAVDGRGREKIAAALVGKKNELAREHRRLFAKSD